MTIHTYGKLPNETIGNYISLRYERWLDYSRFKCSQAGLEGEEVDVLNTVLLDILQKDEKLLIDLYKKKRKRKGIEYTELDFFILKTLELNITSVTAPYRAKRKVIPRGDTDLRKLKIAEKIDTDEEDIPALMLKQFRLINWVLKGLDLTEPERRIFEFKYLLGNRLSSSEWIGPESIKTRYATYHSVLSAIHHVIFYYGYTKIAPQKELNKRELELADRFVRTHKIKTRKSNNLVNI